MSRPSVVFLSAACAAALLLGAPSAHGKPMPPPPPPPPPDSGGAVAPQPQPPPPPATAPTQTEEQGFHRSGWFAGFDLSLGVLNAEGSQDGWSGGGINAHFGGMLTERIGVLFELSGGSYNAPQDYFNPSVTQSQTTVAIGGQVWLNDLVWLRGGFGATQLETMIDTEPQGSMDGRSLLLGAGIELMHRTSFVLDLSGRMTFTGYPADNGMTAPRTTTWNLGVGFNWY